MAQFYKELKELRVSKEISLEELEIGTKINIRYLKAIEEGNFDILPIPYLRLFLRAYAAEIGGEADRALEQLDSFIGNKNPKRIIKQINEEPNEEYSAINKSKISDLISKSNLKLRREIINVIGLSIFFIFSIIIIKKTFSNENLTNNINQSKLLKNQVNIITEEKLLTNYTEDKLIEESLSIEPPFFLTFISGNEIGISIKQDTLNQYIKKLSPGNELNLKGFISKSELIFTNTMKLRTRLNGIELNQINNYPYPIRLIVKANPVSYIAKYYKPLD
ncbi:MAG: hypothetical protein CBD98_001285 [Flavobacteriaceae bacterium TMED238]|nr:MAG: hypothetical protein CBD98_001285 [Flavobacteriaceae bacterium TMED238]